MAPFSQRLESPQFPGRFTLEVLENNDITTLESQSSFLVQCLDAWLAASGRFEDPKKAKAEGLDTDNVAYQGRVLISILTLIPAILIAIKQKTPILVSDKAKIITEEWLRTVAQNAGLLDKGVFISREKFKARRYLGAGGIGLFRDTLWAASLGKKLRSDLKAASITEKAEKARSECAKKLVGTK